MTVLVPSRGPDDWRALLADPVRHWRPGFSAMAAALAWEAARDAPSGLPPEVAVLLGPAARLLLAVPEHKVALPGAGRPSQCDLFALVDLGAETCALAVEAKVDEPFGPTLAEWLDGGGANRRERLAGILALLGLRDAPPSLRYQLLHRAAAAVIEAQRFRAGAAAMVVHSFSPERRWFEDFAAFCALLGVEIEPGRPGERVLPNGRRLLLGWATGALAAPLRAAMIGP